MLIKIKLNSQRGIIALCSQRVKTHWSSQILLKKSESANRSVVSASLQLPGLQSTRLLCPWIFPGKNTGVGSYALLQGIFPTQGPNLGLLHCRQILYHLSHQGRPPDPWIGEQIEAQSLIRTYNFIYLLSLTRGRCERNTHTKFNGMVTSLFLPSQEWPSWNPWTAETASICMATGCQQCSKHFKCVNLFNSRNKSKMLKP